MKAILRLRLEHQKKWTHRKHSILRQLGVYHLKASFTRLIPTLQTMRIRIRSKARSLSESTDRLFAGACEKFPERSPTACLIEKKKTYFPSVRIGVCLELCPSKSTEITSISSSRAPVDAPYSHLRSPLLASKAVLSSWSLVVICALITRVTFKPEMRLVPARRTYYIRTSIYGM